MKIIMLTELNYAEIMEKLEDIILFAPHANSSNNAERIKVLLKSMIVDDKQST